jgi:ATP:ADP antiporter, AAA family
MSMSPTPPPRTSTLGRMLSSVAAIERHELPAVVAAFCLFFCVMGGYFAVRPVRDTVGTLIGRERVADLWMATWLATLVIIPIYGAVVSRFRRGVFLPWTYGAIAVALALVAVALSGGGNLAVAQFFYVFISVLNLFIISVFWSFLLELFRSEQTKRLFGVIAAGGTAGALAGPLFTDITVRTIGNSGVLFLGASLFALAIICQRVLLALWTSGRGPSSADAPPFRDRVIGGNPFAGVTIVLQSPYLLGIGLFVMLLAAVSTFLYFEQLRLVTLTFPDENARTRVFARMDWIVQSLTIVSQMFLTGRIAARRGVALLLTMVPVAMVFGFLILAAWNSFAVLAFIFVARRFGEYAFVRPGREMLWSLLDKETKYKAKNFVDVPVYRGADALVAQLQQAIGNAGFGAQAIALLGAGTAAVWAVNGAWLGRRHDAADADASRAAQADSIPPMPVREAGARP